MKGPSFVSQVLPSHHTQNVLLFVSSLYLFQINSPLFLIGTR